MKNVLVCPPIHYDIEYEINPWMDVKNKVDREKVVKQYQQLKDTYESLGCKVYELTPDALLPDQVYTTNTGHAENGIFIKANFRYPQRRKEADIAEKFFKEELQYEVKKLPENIYFEGHGDLLPDDNFYWMGWGKRSSYEAGRELEDLLQKPVYMLETIDPYFYHLDMCLAPLGCGRVMINPHSFKEAGLQKIHQVAEDVIEVSEADAKAMACNCVVIDQHIVLSQGISDSLKERLTKLGYQLHELEMSEYIKGGGSVFCITLQF